MTAQGVTAQGVTAQGVTAQGATGLSVTGSGRPAQGVTTMRLSTWVTPGADQATRSASSRSAQERTVPVSTT
ncbi:hypothetical protein Pme01_48690 [Planosporangium mesophilum]|uniref:Uncharacterized protein n=1 Tax=Planosporangium mesophilum TaxID=689768 RepID=A0A8J3THI8_9ACTN|nr:hypothetical protein Pme01_48690 [Planosporangium mesophilum]